jgi:uncharacterized damage-inducible protein DinB
MNDDFESLFAYDRWANELVFDACRQLSAEQYVAEPAPGWSSVRATIYHIALVTEGWLRGLSGEQVTEVPSEQDVPTLEDARRHLEHGYRIFEAVRGSLTPERLATPQTFAGRGRTATLPPWVVLRHLVNHSTYHRGQIASKLKRLGVEPPATDLVFWAMQRIAAASEGQKPS